MGVPTPSPRGGVPGGVGLDDAGGLSTGLAATLAGSTPADRERRRIARLLEHRDAAAIGEHLIRRQGRQVTAVRGTSPVTARTDGAGLCARPRVTPGRRP